MTKAMRSRRIRRWWSVVFLLLLCSFCGASWFAGGALVAPAEHSVGRPPDDLPVERVTIPSDSGSLLSAWFVPCDGATATVILLHPIRGDRRSMLARAKLLYDSGYSSLLVDLQAHGQSPGDHITAGYRERHDVAAAVDFCAGDGMADWRTCVWPVELGRGKTYAIWLNSQEFVNFTVGHCEVTWRIPEYSVPGR